MQLVSYRHRGDRTSRIGIVRGTDRVVDVASSAAALGVVLPFDTTDMVALIAAGTPAREALDHYDHAIERLKAGDWSGFGTELDALRPLLEKLNAEH